jgi:hypothetical protein
MRGEVKSSVVFVENSKDQTAILELGYGAVSSLVILPSFFSLIYFLEKASSVVCDQRRWKKGQ